MEEKKKWKTKLGSVIAVLHALGFIVFVNEQMRSGGDKKWREKTK